MSGGVVRDAKLFARYLRAVEAVMCPFYPHLASESVKTSVPVMGLTLFIPLFRNDSGYVVQLCR